MFCMLRNTKDLTLCNPTGVLRPIKENVILFFFNSAIIKSI